MPMWSSQKFLKCRIRQEVSNTSQSVTEKNYWQLIAKLPSTLHAPCVCMWDLDKFLRIEVGDNQDSKGWSCVELCGNGLGRGVCSQRICRNHPRGSCFCGGEWLFWNRLAVGYSLLFPLQGRWIGQAPVLLWCMWVVSCVMLSTDVAHGEGRLILTQTSMRLHFQVAVGKLSGNTFSNSRVGSEWWAPRDLPLGWLISFFSSLRDAVGTERGIMAHFCAPVQIITPTS